MRSETVTERRQLRELSEILALVRDQLAAVEDLLAESARLPEIPILEAVLGAVLAGPAKRLRPALALLACEVFDIRGQEPVRLAAGAEILHSATLVHDDIVDGAAARRGKPAVHVTWSEKVAVLAGDFLFATSAGLIAQLDRPLIVRQFADTIQRMSRSEFVSPSYGDDPAAVREQYLTKIGNKTASLIALPGDAAGELAGASTDERAALHVFGWSLGIAFQIVDDILDISGEAQETGKPVGGDLRQGALTLPVILFLNRNSAGDTAVRRVLAGEAGDGPELDVALRLLRDSGAVAEARQVAASYAERALQALQRLPDGPARDALADLVAYATERTR